ncbi:hypothetical protein LOD99_4719 [Oopsacas minuta]|uniref:Uncharacterized protein n=1 Tax=Oopsacas minuta TaxID=111878 RepID=A0AAV7JSX6_9METZ|nr:hypothetical protein LOD99_4719 [Oopsacas minuta]
MLRTLAEREASANGVEGWLSRVKVRHGICGRALSGDAAGVEKVVLKSCAGFIQSLKLLYRKQVHEHLLTHMVNIDNINKPNGDPYKMITIALAIVWASGASNQVIVLTISKCFSKCGFGVAAVVPELPMIINPEEIQIQREENGECGIFPFVISPEELFEEALINVTQRLNVHDKDCGIGCDSEGDLSEAFPIATSNPH